MKLVRHMAIRATPMLLDEWHNRIVSVNKSKERGVKYKIIKKIFIEGWEIFKEGSFALRAKKKINLMRKWDEQIEILKRGF